MKDEIRDRLTGMMAEGHEYYYSENYDGTNVYEAIADYLLQKGVMVLPCKVGDRVYRIYDDCLFPGDCGTKRMCKGCEYRDLFIEERVFCFSMLSSFGKLEHPYYTTRKEAESALEERRSGDAER